MGFGGFWHGLDPLVLVLRGRWNGFGFKFGSVEGRCAGVVGREGGGDVKNATSVL